jgi:hypothetical protein
LLYWVSATGNEPTANVVIMPAAGRLLHQLQG